MADPYQTLGVQRSDSDAAIRAAYRKLAKKYHPDLNQGKPEAAERFKAISAAYDILSDKEKRARFDRGEIDADGRETGARPPPPGGGGGPWQGQPQGGNPFGEGGFGPEDLETLFGSSFGTAGRGRDMRYTLAVSFEDAANGATRRVLLHDGHETDVHIPAGAQDGLVLRLKGQGRRGQQGVGDALVEIQVAPHRFFRREGDDVVIELPVTLQEAVLGATVEVPTIRGPVRLTIPPNSGTGTRLRLKGRGIRQGHQYVVLNPIFPPGPEPALAEFLRTWQPDRRFNPREGMSS